jgi:hypothetical protein
LFLCFPKPSAKWSKSKDRIAAQGKGLPILAFCPPPPALSVDGHPLCPARASQRKGLKKKQNQRMQRL